MVSRDGVTDLLSPKEIRRQAKVVLGVDFGGQSVRVQVYEDGKKKGDEVSVPTYQGEQGEPVDSKVTGVVGVMHKAISSAVKSAGLDMSKVDAIGFCGQASSSCQTSPGRTLKAGSMRST